MRPLRALLAVVFVALLPSCAAFGTLNLFPDEQLNALGVEAYAEATKEYPVVTSGRDYEMVQRVGRKIAAASEEPFEWEFKLLKADDVPNAFCLPGGKVAIYTGILPVTQDEQGLAAVVGHEVAHATLRHGGIRMTQETLFSVALAAVQAGLSLSEMDDDTKNLTLAALGVGGTVGMLLPYSRGHESEADVLGLRYAIRAGYDPNAAPLLWERMAQLGSGGTPEFLSTHPSSDRRAKTLRDMIPQLRAEDATWDPKQASAR